MSNFHSYWILLWKLRFRQNPSYFLLTYLVPLLFLVPIYMSTMSLMKKLTDNPIPQLDPLDDARTVLKKTERSVVITPNTTYIRSAFDDITNTAAKVVFVNSQEKVAHSLTTECEGGVGFVLPFDVPTSESRWSVMIVNEPEADNKLLWTDAARAICDEIMNLSIVYRLQTFAHPSMSSHRTSRGVVGYCFALPFVTIALMKGLLLSINLRELRIAFLLSLNGISEICQSITSLLVTVIESLPMIVIGSIIFKTLSIVASSNVELFLVSYLIAVLSSLLLISGIITLLHSKKAFGVYLGFGIIIETGMQLVVEFGDYFPPGVLVLIETLFPFGNFIAIVGHGVVYGGLRWDNLNLTLSGISGIAQFICNFVNLLLNLTICIIFNLCNPPPFGPAPIGWRQFFKLSAWKSLFKRIEYVEFKGIDLISVRKVYDEKTIAVADVNLFIQRRECLLCVGANGAGKSTLLEMLCGARQPTSGTITACGSDIFVDIRAYHSILSIVFQDNTLIPNYTTREHITLFGLLNGQTLDEVEANVDRFTSMFKMQDFIDNFSDNLSGGSKRKLCLAIALSKNPQMLVCDEPCAGIDVEARQMIWQAIASYSEMTSFINVHSIDEAESMTNRILVMSQGRVKFLGSPAEMRDKFQCGYKIAFLDQSSMDDILEQVKTIVPEATLSSDHERTLTLPADLRVGAVLEVIGDANYIVHLDSMEITIRKMIEDDEQANHH